MLTETTVTHDHESDALPQAHGKRVICSGKSGPAWDPDGRPLAMALARSLQAQALVAAGDVLTAIKRRVLRDVFPAWSRLLTSARIEIAVPVDVHGLAERMAGPDYRWDTLRDVVLLALTNMDSADAARHWLNADLIMRATAQQEVTRLEAQLDRGTYDDGQPYAALEHGLILSNLDLYRRYADGRN